MKHEMCSSSWLVSGIVDKYFTSVTQHIAGTSNSKSPTLGEEEHDLASFQSCYSDFSLLQKSILNMGKQEKIIEV